MKLLFVFTGGTIGSTQKGDIISPDSAKSYKIISAYEKRYGIDFEYRVTEPYNGLSENNTGEHIRMLAQCLSRAVKGGYDGIIVTHGTDTLQYSAAAIGYAMGLDTVPVCFVSANAPIENGESNGLDNLRGAVDFISQKGGRGVFAVYRNSTEKTVYIHRATRLLESVAFSDRVASAGNIPYGHMDDGRFIKCPHFCELSDEIAPLSCDRLGEVNESTVVISARPGMRYPEISHGVKYVIVNSYHSGTLDTSSEAARRFYLDARNKGVLVFATGAYGGPMYSSVACFEELGIIAIKGISPVAVYVKLWLADSMGNDPALLMERSLSGDLMWDGRI